MMAKFKIPLNDREAYDFMAQAQVALQSAYDRLPEKSRNSTVKQDSARASIRNAMREVSYGLQQLGFELERRGEL
jgi:hypothetical protein